MTQPNGLPQPLDAKSTTMSSDTQEANTGNLRRVKDDLLPGSLFIVLLITFCERAAFWGLTAPWQNYMEHPAKQNDDQTPGALGLGQAKATRAYCGFYIFYYFSPIFVAIIADGPLGQYWTLVISVVLYCLGIIILIITSFPASLTNGWGVPGLAIAMVLVGLGGGGIKAILSSFIADQYPKPDSKIDVKLKTLKNKEEVVIDYTLTLGYIYNLYFWVGNVGSLSWFATVYIEQRHGFSAAYSLPLSLMIVALLLLVLGKPWFQKESNEDTFTVSEATKILTCAARNGFNMSCAISDHNQNKVHDLTRALQGCRVLLSFVTFYVAFDQMQNNLISQAGQMKTHGTPNDIMPAFNQVGCIVIGPTIQVGLYPLLHHRRIYIGPIMRIAIGFGLVALSMIYAAGVQHAIYSARPCSADPSDCSKLTSGSNGVSVWLQIPIYILMSAGEVFCMTTGYEFAYDHSPPDMRVIIQAINLMVAGIGSVVALSLSTVARDPRLVVFYALVAAAMAATTIVFYVVFRSYDQVDGLYSRINISTQNQADIEQGGDMRRAHNLATADTPTNGTSSTALAPKEPDLADTITQLLDSSNTTFTFTTTKGSSMETELHMPQQQAHHTMGECHITKVQE